MQHKITGLFRSDAIHHNQQEGPSKTNPGGGLSTKAKYLALAVPNMSFVTEAVDMGDISIVDVLYFSAGGTEKERDRRIEAYRKHKGFKILWTSDFEILRWLPEHREQILDRTHIIAANSPYMEQLLQGYFDHNNIALLTDPIDTNQTTGNLNRDNTIYSCSQVLLEKGIDDIISLYKGLRTGTPNERKLKRVFVGSSNSWGVDIRDVDSFELELQLDEVCHLEDSLKNEDVLALGRTALIYASFTRFETFGYSLVEALLGGCHVFARPHLAYKDRIDAGVVIPAENALDMRKKISLFLEANDRTRNEDGIQFVHDHYSLDVFRKQFRNIIGDLYAV